MCSILSQVCLAKGHSDEARTWNAQTQKLAHQSRATALEALSLLDALRIDMQRGSFISAQSLLTRSLALFSEKPSQSEPLPLGRLYLYRAWFLWLSGGQDAFLTSCLQEGIRLCTNLRDVSVCYGYAIRALRFAYREEYQHALDELDSAQWLMQRWSVEPKSYLWLDFLRINLWLNQGQLARAKQVLDRHLSLGCAALPQPEIFPMLPRLALLTQARWLLLADKKKECLAYLEKESNLPGSALGQGLTEMIRAQAMRAFYPSEARRALSNIVRFMQRENLSQELLFWLPGLRESLPNKTDEVTLRANLSERELEVLRKIEQGLSNQEIADALFISLHTVKTHARKINTKLSAKNRTQALHKAQALKLL
jgi:LuxR family maltose regulon positive regulatory protein